MTKRKSKRKLRLPAFRRRGQKRLVVRDDFAREYEESLICEDLERHPGLWVTRNQLRAQTPMRYSVKLKATMSRMEKSGVLLARPGTWRNRVFGGSENIAYATLNQLAQEYIRIRESKSAEDTRKELGLSEHFYAKVRGRAESIQRVEIVQRAAG